MPNAKRPTDGAWYLWRRHGPLGVLCLRSLPPSEAWYLVPAVQYKYMNSTEYRSYLESDHWQHLRLKKLKRSRACWCCRSERKLEVHHIRYRQLYDVTVNDLRVLCAFCHDLYHAYQKKRPLATWEDLLGKVKRFHRKSRRAQRRTRWQYPVNPNIP